MILDNVRNAILQCDGKNYSFLVTDREYEYGKPGVRVSGLVLDTFEASNRRAEERRTCAIERVIFNDPATIVIWSDKTKTVVKCQPGDTYDHEKGLALCISKKLLGNKGNFNEVFKKWIPEYPSVIDDLNDDVIRVGSKVEVIQSGLLYSTYKSWVEENVRSKADCEMWEEGSWVRNGYIGRVKTIADHGRGGSEPMAYVDFGGRCAIIEIRGLKKIK